MAKTALDLTEKEKQQYQPAEILKSRGGSKLDRETALLRQGAWHVARKAADLLRKDFGAKKIAVFGSLIHEGSFGLWSDIDLAAWEIPPDLYYSAVAVVTGLSPLFKVDLVDVEECRPILRKMIEQEGIQI